MMEDPESQADVCCQGVLSKTFMGLCPCSVVLVEAVAASDSKKKRCIFSKISLACRDCQWQFLPCLCFIVVFFYQLYV